MCAIYAFYSAAWAGLVYLANNTELVMCVASDTVSPERCI